MWPQQNCGYRWGATVRVGAEPSSQMASRDRNRLCSVWRDQKGEQHHHHPQTIPWGLSNDGAIQRTSLAGSSLGALGNVWRSMWVP